MTTKVILIRVSEAEKALWARIAKAEDRSLVAMLRFWMTQHPGRKGATLHRDADGNLVDGDGNPVEE